MKRDPVQDVVERVLDPYRCWYDDCPEHHPTTTEAERANCPLCVETERSFGRVIGSVSADQSGTIFSQ